MRVGGGKKDQQHIHEKRKQEKTKVGVYCWSAGRVDGEREGWKAGWTDFASVLKEETTSSTYMKKGTKASARPKASRRKSRGHRRTHAGRHKKIKITPKNYVHVEKRFSLDSKINMTAVKPVSARSSRCD